MKRNCPKGNIILNILLLTALVLLLAVPTAINFGFLQKPNTTEKVAGLQTLAYQDFLIQPNLTDFGELANFSEPQDTNGEILENVALTFFPNQIATYRRLFSLSNNLPQKKTLTVTIKSKTGLDSNINVVGQIENGEKYPVFQLNQPFVLSLKSHSQAYLTILLSQKTNGVASRQLPLQIVFSWEAAQD